MPAPEDKPSSHENVQFQAETSGRTPQPVNSLLSPAGADS